MTSATSSSSDLGPGPGLDAGPGPGLDAGPGSGPPLVVPALAGLCRVLLVLRLVVLGLTSAGALMARDDVPLLLPLGLSSALTVLLLRRWGDHGRRIAAEPAVVGADIAFAVVFLLVVDRAGAFSVYGLTAAAGAGLLLRAPVAAAGVAALVAAQWSVTAREPGALTFESAVGLPALLAVVAVAGAATSRELVRAAALERALAASRERHAAEHAEAAERLRLARDLHDTVGTTLHGVALSFAGLRALVAADPEAAERLAGRLSDDVGEAARQVRALVAGRRADPPQGDLGVEVVRAVRRTQAVHGTRAAVLELRPAALEPRVAHEVLAVLREALENAGRHAGAGPVTVRLAPGPARGGSGWLRLVVADGGPGFEPGARSGMHHGLLGMRERARDVGGRLQVASAPGRGTVVTLDVPTGPTGPTAPTGPTGPAGAAC